MTWEEFLNGLEKLKETPEGKNLIPNIENLEIIKTKDFITKWKICYKYENWDEFDIVEKYFFIELSQKYNYWDNIIVYFLFKRNQKSGLLNQWRVEIKNYSNNFIVDFINVLFY